MKNTAIGNLTEYDPSCYSVLIVDDLSKNIQVLGSTLWELGYEVDYATSGKKALELIDKNQFDLILLDIMMPQMDGFEVCSIVRKNRTYDNTPIIFLTAKIDKKSILQGFEVGGQDYVVKPFDSNELLARVKTHIELKESKEKLKNTNKWLEEKVKERTLELEIANDKLKKLDEAKSQFLNIISHEIRTPLMGIIGGVNLIQDSALPEETYTYLDLLNESSLRLESFSNKALDISDLNILGSRLMTLSETEIRPFFQNIVDLYRDRFEEKNLELISTYNLELQNFRIDKVYFNKCIYNFFDNVIEYATVGTKVNLEVSKDHNGFFMRLSNQGVKFPTGYSISTASPFTSVNHVDQNPGLSLFLSKLIVEAHRGEIKNGNVSDGVFIEVHLNPKLDD